ncbi:Hypothetical protein CINCED_3A011324 [Cinara cedri]|uniref:Uncharacterized protein n=1 Tax=Cinara cedri TaxID=506608 RepID=A0A5E4N0E1_9HEMI|nr:Hypothetical protein CINCED_3A011324 [Cinara cedri]
MHSFSHRPIYVDLDPGAVVVERPTKVEECFSQALLLVYHYDVIIELAFGWQRFYISKWIKTRNELKANNINSEIEVYIIPVFDQEHFYNEVLKDVLYQKEWEYPGEIGFSHWRISGTRERDPRYQKLRVRGIRIRNTRRGQPARCAMGKSRPGGTASLITVNLDANNKSHRSVTEASCGPTTPRRVDNFTDMRSHLPKVCV